MSWLDEFDWGEFAKSTIGGVIQAVPAIYASTQGAKKIVAGNNQAAAVAQQTGVQNQQLIREQMGRADVAAAPAIAHFRNTLSRDPSELTPAQEIAIGDSQRTMNNQNLVGTVGGRAFSRMFADTTGRLRANAVQQNQQRSDAAASQVGSLGVQTAGLNAQGTNALVTNNNDVATNVGNAVTDSSRASAEPYAAIASVFANSVKDVDRKSRYEEYKAARS